MKTKRFIAYLIDWYIGTIITYLPLSLVSLKFYHTMKIPLEKMPSNYIVPIFVCCLVLAIFYYVYVPYKIYDGQTLGKHLLKLSIVSDTNRLTFKQLLIRQVLGMVFIEGYLISASALIRKMIVIYTHFNDMYIFTYLALGISIISALLAIFSTKQKAIHDYLAHTQVINLS